MLVVWVVVLIGVDSVVIRFLYVLKMFWLVFGLDVFELGMCMNIELFDIEFGIEMFCEICIIGG